MGRSLIATLIGVPLAACTGPSGSLDLVLELPPSGELRPSGMTQVSLTTEEVGGTSSVLTTPVTSTPGGGIAFAAGDVQAGVPITLAVELRDAANRLVGFGENDTPVTPSAKQDQTVTITVRKPIVYVSSDKPVHTLDPTLDALDPKYQGALASSAAIVVPVDGTQMASIAAGTVTLISTSDHHPVGNPITIPGGGATDAAPLPGERKLVVAGAMGLVVVDVDAGSATPIGMSPRPDRVAVGGDTTAGFVAYALSGRVAPPTGSGTCSGSSTVTEVALDGGQEIPTTITSGMPLSDIAAIGIAVYGANPCAGTVTRLDSGMPALSLPLSGAATVAISDQRLWAVGSEHPATSNTPEAARLVLGSINIDGSDMRVVKLPPKTEDVIYQGDQAQELSLQLHADTYVPLDLAVLPGGQYVATIGRMDAHRDARGDQFGKVIPEMQITVLDVVLADPQTGAVSQRIRASCNLMVINGSSAEFPTWACQTAQASETPAGGEFMPTAVGALYGDR